MSFTVAVIGRPNVGKSTLFNRLTGKRLAIVDDTPGVTRDRREGAAAIADLDFTLIDTAGLDDSNNESLEARMHGQSERAIQDADVALFLIDARAGVMPLDKHFSDWLRKHSTPVVLVANKCEGGAGQGGLMEAFSLGLGEPIPVSAEHGEGLDGLYEALLPFDPIIDESAVDEPAVGEPAVDEPTREDNEEDDWESRPLQLAIVGRPNVGKSTIINKLLGEDRVLTGPEAGITRDSISISWTFKDRAIRLIDTAGLRETGDMVEIEGAARARRAAQGADLCLVIFDAAAGPGERAWAAGECGGLEAPSLLVANKIDLPEARFPTAPAASGNGGNSLPYEGFCQISALRNEGVDALRRAMAGALAGEAGEAGAGGQALLTRERHRDLVAKCRKAAGRAGDALFSGESPELAAVHLNEAQAALSSLLGRDYGEALLDRIFSEFCIGK